MAALFLLLSLSVPPHHAIRGAHCSVEIVDLGTNDQGRASVHNSLAAATASNNLAIDSDAGIKQVVDLNN